MIIKKISLKNFISCEKVNLNIPLGLVGITGSNGSGKSTIFRDGIYYSLYGNSLRHKSPTKYIKHNEKEFELSTLFHINNNEYNIQRNVNSKNKREVKLEINGEEENSLKTDIQYYINELIGLDQNLFNQTILITPDSKCLLELSNNERKTFFYKLLKLEEFDKIYAISNKKRNETEKKINILEYELLNIEKDIKIKNSEISSIKEDKDIEYILQNETNIRKNIESQKMIEFLEQDFQKNKKLLTQCTSNLLKFYSQEEIDNINKIKGDIAEIKNKISLIKGQIQNNNLSLKKLQSLLISSSATHSCPTCEQKLDINSLSMTIKNIEINNDELNNSLNKLLVKEEKINLCQNYINLKEEYEKSFEKINKANNSIKNEKYDLNSLIKAKNSLSRIEFLEQEIKQKKSILNDKKKELILIKNKIPMLDNIIEFALKTPDLLVKEIFKSILAKANEFLSLIPNTSLLDVEDIEESQYKYSVSSTGEKFKINIIIRIAMNTILSEILKKKPIELLILDEGGLGHLDFYIANEIVAILKNLINSEVLKQIFLVTHNTDLLEYCDTKINIEKVKNNTVVHIC